LCFCLVRTFGSFGSTFNGIILSVVDKNLRILSEGRLLDKRENFESSIAATAIADFDKLLMFHTILVHERWELVERRAKVKMRDDGIKMG
jgi:hypothetical protein